MATTLEMICALTNEDNDDNSQRWIMCQLALLDLTKR